MSSQHLPHPFMALLSRYRAVFSASWAARHELAGPKRLASEAAFLPAALSLQASPPHPAPRRTALVLCGLFLIALTWAIVGQVDIVAVATGRIVVGDRTKVIQPLERSVVQAILVKDGDKVKEGQLLVELDATTARADLNRVGQERSAAVADFGRARALLDGLAGNLPVRLPKDLALSSDERTDADAQLHAEWLDIAAKVAQLQAQEQHRVAEALTVDQQIGKLNATLPMVRQREDDFQALTTQGFVSSHSVQDRRRERVEMERDLATLQARRQEAQASLAEARSALAAYKAETQRTLRQRLADADLKQHQLGEETTKSQLRTRLTRLVAPVTGTVQQLAVHTPGGVVTEAQALMVIVPDDAQVTAEVVLENRDIGFVTPGQTAEVKLETFPYTRYGTLRGTVKTVSADAVNDEKRGAIFPATLVMEQPWIEVDGRQVRLSPGMNLTAEVKTGKRRVIDYLLSPVQQTTTESLRER